MCSHAWTCKLLLLALAAPVAAQFAPKIAAICDFRLDASPFLFGLAFCGFTLALGLGIRHYSAALLLAFIASCFYFSSPSGPMVRGADWARVLLILAVMFAPLRLVSRLHAPAATWPSAYLPSLDGWRAVAIFLVMMDHAAREIAAEHHHPVFLLFLQGQHGVNIFFGLSGLLITWKLLEERRHTGSISLAGFYRRRVYRIFPAAAAFVSAIVVLALAGIVPLNRVDLISTVLYVRNYIPVEGPLNQATGHFWSLALEEQFYLVLPLLLLVLGARRLQALAVVLIAACAAWRWYFFTWLAPPDPLLSTRFHTDFRIDGLLCGCLLAIVLADPGARSFAARSLSAPVWAAAAVLCLWWVVRHGEATTLMESLLIPVLLAGTLLAPYGTMARILEWRPLRWVGRISYSLYLWQQLFLCCPATGWLMGELHRFPISLAATFACATLSYYCIERPALRAASRMPAPAGEGSFAAAQPEMIPS